MSIVIGRGFAEAKILKTEPGPSSSIMRNILIKIAYTLIQTRFSTRDCQIPFTIGRSRLCQDSNSQKNQNCPNSSILIDIDMALPKGLTNDIHHWSRHRHGQNSEKIDPDLLPHISIRFRIHVWLGCGIPRECYTTICVGVPGCAL